MAHQSIPINMLFPHSVLGCQVHILRLTLHTKVAVHSISSISVSKPRNDMGNELFQRFNSHFVSLWLAHVFHVRLIKFDAHSANFLTNIQIPGASHDFRKRGCLMRFILAS
jgi:hypothetical protein